MFMSETDDGVTLNDLVLRRPVASPPPDQLILRDANGQPWAVTVGADGQLQTGRYPDGKPSKASDYAVQISVNAIKDTVGNKLADLFESISKAPSFESLKSSLASRQLILAIPNLPESSKRMVLAEIEKLQKQIDAASAPMADQEAKTS
jgi:hypothetical protein